MEFGCLDRWLVIIPINKQQSRLTIKRLEPEPSLPFYYYATPTAMMTMNLN